MNIEQLARDFIIQMDDPQATRSRLAPDATVSGGILPQTLPASQAIDLMGALKTAFPDLKFNVKKVTVNGNQARVETTWSGTNTGALNLPVPGMDRIQPTGKRVSVNDEYLVTVQGDKISHLEVQSPSNGGIPGALQQLGVKTPGF